ncbi:hypothetical protein VitviT2T_020068 [Vitis vinifera]|uniref:Mediator complex subunit 15 KIX domain-containing protein n=1 Tax=Vitis vinifera TaxID=29760 RepID=A0ABY9D2W6_VITVI|nr:mediator of RNA polymerase II transcription subunit 15a isoform X2 [Vitis vinifera]WKA01807.1 hypothetical protein VitviT2T_020068 [Vitis vinifera]|eukprot:XP_010645551.1 PREDICTED: mediator of RNA polymerase II transcription subunit 15a isoform X2 [Vitis vinifera]
MTLPTRNAGVSVKTFSHPTLSWPRAEPVMGGGDWRTQLPPSARQRIANKIMDKLKRHLPASGPEGLHELRKIAERFEEKIYSTATSQSDYLRKLSLKMLTMETKFCNAAMPSNSTGPNKKSSNGKKSTAGKKSAAGKKSHRSRF